MFENGRRGVLLVGFQQLLVDACFGIVQVGTSLMLFPVTIPYAHL
jgi:hypothetical protein